MRTGKYCLLELFDNHLIDQFIIPEIQRDYVWKTGDVVDFLEYIKEGYLGDRGDKPYIGFIYAYPSVGRKYILIDGQQRITTLYLLLILLYMRSGKALPRFLLDNEQVKVDYKVRQNTHDFLNELVRFCDRNPEQYNFEIEDQNFYFTAYKNDLTIENLIANFGFIRKWLEGIAIDENSKFLKFLEDDVDLSYFDIRESDQGEDLYLYMNSRGRPLVTNETLKAQFLATANDKEKDGMEWEEWQDFFWKHRNENNDADPGFNDFLRMVQIINMAERNKTNEEIGNFAGGKSSSLEASLMNLPDNFSELARYFYAFQWMVVNKIVDEFYTKYENKQYITTPKPVDRSQTFYFTILPSLCFIAKTGCRDEEIVLRFIRFFYNLSRKSQTIGKDISTQLPVAVKLMLEYSKKQTDKYDVTDLKDYTKGRTTLINTEEVLKLDIIKNPPVNIDRYTVEQAFWAAEDHKVFQGEIEFLLTPHFDEIYNVFKFSDFKKSWKIFSELFKSEDSDHRKLITALILHSNTSVQVSPYYYENYDYADWASIVRTNRKNSLLTVIKKLYDQPLSHLDNIIKDRAKHSFNELYSSVAELKAEKSFSQQVKILAILDYFTEGVMFDKNTYVVSKDVRFIYGKHTFFDDGYQIFNVNRYIGDGNMGNLMFSMRTALSDNRKLDDLLYLIKNGETYHIS